MLRAYGKAIRDELEAESAGRKAALITANTTRARLLSALLHQALTPAPAPAQPEAAE